MTVLVDECRWPWRGRLWCHLVSDESFEELHHFARSLGIPRVAFQGDHYDLHESGRHAALERGATPVTGRELVRAITAARLRRGPALLRGGIEAVAGLAAPRLETERLLLRQWTPEDLDPMHTIESDPEVMQFLGGPASRMETKDRIDRDAVGLALRGFGKWAVERRDTGELIGRVGLSGADPQLPFAPVLEIGWRLSRSSQGMGFATEAAREALRYGFVAMEVDRIAGFTAPANRASRAVFARLEMTEAGEFDHPGLSEPERRQVLAWALAGRTDGSVNVR